MKKVFFSLLAVAAIASCAKTESFYVGGDSEISFSPVASMITKADFTTAITDTEYPAEENFVVVGYWANEPAGSDFTVSGTETPYLDYAEFAKSGQYWAGYDAETDSHYPYYWPKNGSLRFACYSPAVVAGGTIEHTLATDTWTATGYTQPSETAQTIDFMVAETPASYTSATAAENVAVVFEHALSWITLKVKAADEAADEAFTINKVTINDVYTVADMVATYPDKEWSNWSEAAAYEVFAEGEFLVKYVDDAEIIETTENGTVVIPQATTTVTIEYTQNALGGTPVLEGQKTIVPLALNAELSPWEPGKHYVYTIIFGREEIFINPSVAEWDEVVVEPDVEVGAVKVATAAELAAAVAKGGDVVLTADITVDETVVVNEKVVLDLNGMTLTNKVDNASTDVIVVGAEGELTINGTGTVEAVTGNDGYTVIAEGKVIINGGTFKSGVDAANKPNAVVYARGNGEVYVNGGNFPNDNASKFVLNKKDADRATTIIEVTGGTYGAFNPEDNAAEGPGTNFVKDGYKAVDNGDGTFTVVAE